MTPLLARTVSVLAHRYRQHLRGLTLGARGVAMREHDGVREVLLIRHTYAPGFQLPGGGVEPGESAVDALRREMWEEARVRVVGPPRLLGLYHHGPDWPRDHVAVYLLDQFTQPETPKPDREIGEHLWAPVDALPDATMRSARARITEVVQSREPGTTWVP